MSQIALINCSNKEVIGNIKKSFINMKMGDSKVDKSTFKLFDDIKQAFLSMKKEDTPFVICDIDGYEKEIYNLLVMLERSSSFLKVKVILLSDNVNSIHEKISNRKNFFFAIEKSFSREYLLQKITTTIKEQKEKKEQSKLVRYRNQGGAKIVLVAVERYLLRELKLKVKSESVKKSVLSAFNKPTEILQDEYFEIASKILLPYIEKKEQIINEKRLYCLLKEQLDKVEVVFVGHIYDDLMEKFSDEFLEKIENSMLDKRIDEHSIVLEFLTLESLIKQLQVSNSDASPLSYKNCNYAIRTMYNQFIQIDCDINSQKLRQSLKRLTLLENFHTAFEESFLDGKLASLSKNENILFEKRSILIRKSNSLLNKVDYILSKYLYHFSNELWRNVKASELLIHYFQKLKKVKMSNYAYARYLTMKAASNVDVVKGFSKAEEYFDKLDREIIALVGDDADILHLSKRALEDYLRTVDNQRVSVFGFTKANIFEVWLKSNRPTRIVVTEAFKSKHSTQGLDYLKQLQSSMKKSDIFKNRNAFLLSENYAIMEQVEMTTQYKTLKYPMHKKDIEKFILYN